ncbi:MAG: hypothetical protein AAFP82_11890, partial [Bacteroidota bacterium]
THTQSQPVVIMYATGFLFYEPLLFIFIIETDYGYSTLRKMPIVHFPPLCGEKWGGFGGETQYFAVSKILCFSSKPPLRTAFGGEHTHISKKVG